LREHREEKESGLFNSLILKNISVNSVVNFLTIPAILMRVRMTPKTPQSSALIAIVLFIMAPVGFAQSQESVKPAIGKVAPSTNEICPILVGDSVPELTLTSIDGAAFNLNDAIKKKPTVLIFYRGGW
jgi:hypothetical protein